MPSLSFARVVLLVAVTSTTGSRCGGGAQKAGDATVTNAAAVCEAVPLSCEDGWTIEHRYEDGQCVSSPRASCFPYACDDPPTSCRVDCEDDDDCSGGAVCVPGGTCSVIPPSCYTTCEDDLELTFVWREGECALDMVIPCFPYGCDDETGTCARDCVVAEHCAVGASCDGSGHCAPREASCSTSSTLELSDGQFVDCSPYRCVGNACRDWCTRDADCVGDATCELRSQTCVPPPA